MDVDSSGVLERVLKGSGTRLQAAQHEPDVGKVEPRLRRLGQALVIPAQSAAAGHPRKGALYHPATVQHHESLLSSQFFDHLHGPV